MKKILLLFLTLLAAVGVKAERIDSRQAAEIAGRFFSEQKKQTVKPQFAARRMATGKADVALLYVFNATDNGGFVVISGDDAVPPILGYADSGSFDLETAPPAFREWYEKAAALMQTVVSDANAPQLLTYSPKDGSDLQEKVMPLIQTKWSQHAPYNLYSPYDESEGARCVTGCVPTAMAQICYYYKYPLQGKGSGYYYFKGVTYRENDLSVYNFDYEKLVLDYQRDGGTVEQKDEVAKLHRYCALVAHSTFGVDATSTPYIKNCMIDMGFSADQPSFSTKSAELDYILGEINEGRPIYAASKEHAFILDGYDADHLVHVNWGWGGNYDGYYNTLTTMYPSSYSFDLLNYVVGGIKVNTSFSPSPVKFVSHEVSGGKAYKGKEYELTLNVKNTADGEFYGKLKLERTDGTPVFQEYTRIGAGETKSKTVRIQAPDAAGTDALQLSAGGSFWSTIGSFNVPVVDLSSGAPNLSAASMSLDNDVVQQGEDLVLHTTISNSGGFYEGELALGNYYLKRQNVLMLNNGEQKDYVSQFETDTVSGGEKTLYVYAIDANDKFTYLGTLNYLCFEPLDASSISLSYEGASTLTGYEGKASSTDIIVRNSGSTAFAGIVALKQGDKILGRAYMKIAPSATEKMTLAFGALSAADAGNVDVVYYATSSKTVKIGSCKIIVNTPAAGDPELSIAFKDGKNFVEAGTKVEKTVILRNTGGFFSGNFYSYFGSSYQGRISNIQLNKDEETELTLSFDARTKDAGEYEISPYARTDDDYVDIYPLSVLVFDPIEDASSVKLSLKSPELLHFYEGIENNALIAVKNFNTKEDFKGLIGLRQGKHFLGTAEVEIARGNTVSVSIPVTLPADFSPKDLNVAYVLSNEEQHSFDPIAATYAAPATGDPVISVNASLEKTTYCVGETLKANISETVSSGFLEGSRDVYFYLNSPWTKLSYIHYRYNLSSGDEGNSTLYLTVPEAEVGATVRCILYYVDGEGNQVARKDLSFQIGSTTGIQQPTTEADWQNARHYDATGRQIPSDRKGVHIQRLPNGQTKKVVR